MNPFGRDRCAIIRKREDGVIEIRPLRVIKRESEIDAGERRRAGLTGVEA